jgi:hypothetical protein
MADDQTAGLDPQRALTAIAKLGPELAKAKGELAYLDGYTKSLKATLMRAAAAIPEFSSAVAQEREALADEKYIEHIVGLGVATEVYEALRWRMVRAEATIEVWRSMEASNRRMDRGAA